MEAPHVEILGDRWDIRPLNVAIPVFQAAYMALLATRAWGVGIHSHLLAYQRGLQAHKNKARTI